MKKYRIDNLHKVPVPLEIKKGKRDSYFFLLGIDCSKTLFESEITPMIDYLVKKGKLAKLMIEEKIKEKEPALKELEEVKEGEVYETSYNQLNVNELEKTLLDDSEDEESENGSS